MGSRRSGSLCLSLLTRTSRGSVLYVRATRTGLLRAMRARGSALLAPGTSSMVQASGVLYVPHIVAPQVLGVISNQRTPKTREWIRSTYMAEAASLEGVLLRFVIGRHGLNQVS